MGSRPIILFDTTKPLIDTSY